VPEHQITHIVTHRIDFIIMILFGAVAHTAWQLKKAKLNKTVFTLLDGIISMIIAMFSGTLSGIATAAAGQSELYAMVAASIGAWLGVTGLNYFADRFTTGQ